MADLRRSSTEHSNAEKTASICHVVGISKQAAMRESTRESGTLQDIIEKTIGQGDLEVIINANGAGKYIAQMLAHVTRTSEEEAETGNWLKTMRARSPDKMWFAEAHKTNTDDTVAMTNHLEATLRGRWVTFIAPCIAKIGRASCRERV